MNKRKFNSLVATKKRITKRRSENWLDFTESVETIFLDNPDLVLEWECECGCCPFVNIDEYETEQKVYKIDMNETGIRFHCKDTETGGNNVFDMSQVSNQRLDFLMEDILAKVAEVYGIETEPE